MQSALWGILVKLGWITHGLLVYINFVELDRGEFCCELGEYRRYNFAGTAPGGPEVEDSRGVLVDLKDRLDPCARTECSRKRTIS